jgi:hypothetical protein
MSKQTAVKWLVEQMIDKLGIRIENTTEGCELFNQAKAMEKEQIENAYWDGGEDIPMINKQCEQYYNDTFKNK